MTRVLAITDPVTPWVSTLIASYREKLAVLGAADAEHARGLLPHVQVRFLRSPRRPRLRLPS